MRHGLKLLVLCTLAALSVMVVTAAAAQAGEFRIGTPLKTFTTAKVTEKSILGEIEGGYLLIEGFSIHCPGGTETTVTGVIKQGGTGNATALFKGCKVDGSEKHCWIWDDLGTDNVPSTLLGKDMITASGTGKLLLHDAEDYFLVEGLPKKTLKEQIEPVFSLFDIGGDPLCPLGTDTEPFHIEITGSTVVRLPTALKDEKLQTIESLGLETLHKLFSSDKLFLAGNEAHLSKNLVDNGEPVKGFAHLAVEPEQVWGAE